jgi:hypothetical protein
MSDIALIVEQKTQRKARNKLTSEMKIDNLEKFAKTSPVAEVIPDRLKSSRKEVERGVRVGNKYRRPTAHQVRGHKSGLCRFRP